MDDAHCDSILVEVAADEVHGFLDEVHGILDEVHGFLDEVHGFLLVWKPRGLQKRPNGLPRTQGTLNRPARLPLHSFTQNTIRLGTQKIVLMGSRTISTRRGSSPIGPRGATCP
jgi:hypothetical protein